MKKITYLIEPETGDRYTRDQVPSSPLAPIGQYTRIGDFRPPRIWSEFEPNSVYWDPHFVRMSVPEYTILSHVNPDGPVGISIQAIMMGKSYARKNGVKSPGGPGVIFWAWFSRVPPCWLVVDKEQSYKMLSEQEAGMLH